MDAGIADAGRDAGTDADVDGGPDAGFDAGPPLVLPLPRYGVTLARGYDQYGNVFALGGIDATGAFSTRVEEFQTHISIGTPVYNWNATPFAALPQPIAFAASASYHLGRLEDGQFLIGGVNDAGVSFVTNAADLGASSPSWVSGPTLPQTQSYAGASVDPDDSSSLIWLIGGFDQAGAPSAVVFALDLQMFADGGVWGAGPALNHARGGLGVDVIQGHTAGVPPPVAFAIGGWERDAGTLVPSSVAEAYVSGRGWADLPPLPLGRGGLAVASDDNCQVFAVGGSTGVYGSPIPTAQIDVFNADAGTWTTLDAGLATARWGLGAALGYVDGGAGDVIVIFGGQLPDGGVSGETDILNPATLQIVVLPGG